MTVDKSLIEEILEYAAKGVNPIDISNFSELEDAEKFRKTLFDLRSEEKGNSLTNYDVGVGVEYDAKSFSRNFYVHMRRKNA